RPSIAEGPAVDGDVVVGIAAAGAIEVNGGGCLATGRRNVHHRGRWLILELARFLEERSDLGLRKGDVVQPEFVEESRERMGFARRARAVVKVRATVNGAQPDAVLVRPDLRALPQTD